MCIAFRGTLTRSSFVDFKRYQWQNLPLGAPLLPPPPCRLGDRGRTRGARGAGISDVASCMLMGRPSRGTPLYCFIALMASARRSNTTSAVPVGWKRKEGSIRLSV